MLCYCRPHKTLRHSKILTILRYISLIVFCGTFSIRYNRCILSIRVVNKVRDALFVLFRPLVFVIA